MYAENLFKIPVIHTNLNGYAEYPPPLQGAQRAGDFFNCIAIHRKLQTRRVAEDSTLLYGAGFPKKWLRHFLGKPGQATQHRMRLSVDGYSHPP